MPTIRDVAELAGVGVATVSRFIAGKGAVSDKTVIKLRRAIATLDYRPSHIARALPSGQTRTIGVYVPVIHGAFYAPMLQAVCNTLTTNGLRMMVAIGNSTKRESEGAMLGAQFLDAHGCDGLVVMATALSAAEAGELVKLQPHTVLLNRMVRGLQKRCFAPNHQAAGKLAAATLWQAGHRRIAAIEGLPDSLDNVARMRGFFDELAKRGIDKREVPVVSGQFSAEGGKTAAATLLSRHAGFTALFCASDESAIGALSYLHQAGIVIPRDVSVLGYDGLEFSGQTAPPLTTVRIPWDEICVNAVHLLANERYGLKLPVKRIFTPQIVWRASLKKLTANPTLFTPEEV